MYDFFGPLLNLLKAMVMTMLILIAAVIYLLVSGCHVPDWSWR